MGTDTTEVQRLAMEEITERRERERYERLPTWARHRIEKLESDSKHWKNKALEMEKGDTNTFQRDYSGSLEEDRRPMARDSQILFVTDETEFEVGFRNGVLEVNATGRLRNDRMIVRPISSNLVAIEGYGH